MGFALLDGDTKKRTSLHARHLWHPLGLDVIKLCSLGAPLRYRIRVSREIIKKKSLNLDTEEKTKKKRIGAAGLDDKDATKSFFYFY